MAAEEEKVLYEKRGKIAIITLNRPEARNAVNGQISGGIERGIDAYESDPDVWCAILAANGPVFCAGADLKLIAAGKSGESGTEKGGFGGIVRRERTKPLIAAVTGSALAGGTEIALSCDLIVCSTETNFGLPETKRSLAAAAGGLFRLPRAIGMTPALECIMTGDPLPAERAYQLGMVNYMVPNDQVLDEAIKLAERICTAAPLAVQASRKVAIRAFTDTDDELWSASSQAFVGLRQTEDFAEGPRAFVEKRPPEWKGK